MFSRRTATATCQRYLEAGAAAAVYHDPTGAQRAQLADIITRHPEFAEDNDVLVDDASAYPGASAYVESYHVDSAEGLALLARTIASLPAAPDKIAEAARND